MKDMDEEKKTILIIDDEVDFAEALRETLEIEGFRVLTAYDGQKGLNVLSEEKPHLIILDLKMPRMSGIEFYRRIYDPKEGKPEVPVLILTAQEHLAEAFRDLKAAGFIAKPFATRDLVERIHTILNQKEVKVPVKLILSEQKQRKVLIVQDNQSDLDLMVLTFVNAGYLVSVSKSAAEAEQRALMDQPDVMLIKLNLPDLQGDLLACKLKQAPKTREIKYLLFTLFSKDADYSVTNIWCQKLGIPELIRTDDPDTLLKEANDVLFPH